MAVFDELLLGSLSEHGSRSDWQRLENYLEHHKLSPLDGWKHLYEEWRAAYEYFRALEQQTLYTADEADNPATPNAETLHFHGKLVRLLLESGEQWLNSLMSLKLDQSEEMQRIEYNSRLCALLDSLRESLILWHSDEPPSSQRIRQLFSNAAR